VLKFIVMSDLHIVPAGRLSNGIDTAGRLRRAIAHINAHHADAAFCAIAGDLVDDGDAPSYRRVAAIVADAVPPVRFTLGNHDHRHTFLDVFGTRHAASTGYLDAAIDAGGYRVILLDSLAPGTDAGHIDPVQIVWLEDRLAEVSRQPVIVVLHHAICPLGVPMDFIRLQDPEPLVAALARHGDVRQVITGHVHMPTAGTFHGIPFTTIAGNHYTMGAKLTGPLDTVPRYEGPGQIAVVLAGPDGVVVHHENFFDRHAREPVELHGGKPDL
jgi:3',5'-cyclic-AMP phosphodiesterase